MIYDKITESRRDGEIEMKISELDKRCEADRFR